MTNKKADIGIFGGSGFYDFLEKIEEVSVETPYGPPSDNLFLGKVGDKTVAFLPRHGRKHSIPPQKINYRANLWAMKELGISRIISPCAVGSLQKVIKPGDFVISDQYIDRTRGRIDTFYDGPIATHVSAADPYCPELRELAIKATEENKVTCHKTGTIVVIQGPRFSTKAESKWFTSMGWTTINMTQYPEAHLAKELEMCVVNIALATDYDSGLVGDVQPVSHNEVMIVFQQNLEKLRKVLFKLIEIIPHDRKKCKCSEILKHSRFL
ncbi:MAG: methylthioadenosine phosphorylase [Candidatus Melainabacteria bacterium RIFCSPHIGHO2_02_FULL_34_12]|nr:MAG: methylthioadenosine phosphorylase [Candidatus Melainabacteria bacterium RIFCSPHIGHO2_02_FULL_34_12]